MAADVPSPPVLGTNLPFDPTMLSFFRITPSDTALYEQTRAFRLEHLLRPVGVDGWWHLDDTSQHFVCVGYGQLVGVVLFDPERRKLHQMVVHPGIRGAGVGRGLVSRVEEFALARGMDCVELNARHYAVPFYEKLGYVKEGEAFQEVGMDHYRMCKKLDLAAASEARAAQAALLSDVQLREAVDTDVAALTSVINEAYRVECFLKRGGGDRTDEAEVASLLALPEATFLVATLPAEAYAALGGPGGAAAGAAAVDGRVLVGCLLYKRKSAEAAYFGMLSVRRCCQGASLSRRLVDRAEALAREEGRERMELVIVSCRPELAVFYSRLGYKAGHTSPWPEEGKHVLEEGLRDTYFIHLSKPLGGAS
eukprot:CAMPEP_0196773726 /NCGR_PEP_ID=MMETSP1104-20130614/2946_1 /TAXON_ID=33652 /ORGANISM="Cafeteria sp., Strain Caron Lab Isolate" /LENGTH=365 /DNA_ID=CAMNT_0042143877 /DNA_START=21 /DNA_END=1114 /DNA_ORIENTATION=-